MVEKKYCQLCKEVDQKWKNTQCWWKKTFKKNLWTNSLTLNTIWNYKFHSDSNMIFPQNSNKMYSKHVRICKDSVYRHYYWLIDKFFLFHFGIFLLFSCVFVADCGKIIFELPLMPRAWFQCVVWQLILFEMFFHIHCTFFHFLSTFDWAHNFQHVS